MKRNYTFEETQDLDSALLDLAMYEVTKGLIIMPNSMEEYSALKKKFYSTFNRFKKLIQAGECSFEFIKKTVLAKNGPFPAIKYSDEDIIADLEERSKEPLEPIDPMESNELRDPTDSLELDYIGSLVSSSNPSNSGTTSLESLLGFIQGLQGSKSSDFGDSDDFEIPLMPPSSLSKSKKPPILISTETIKIPERPSRPKKLKKPKKKAAKKPKKKAVKKPKNKEKPKKKPKKGDK